MAHKQAVPANTYPPAITVDCPKCGAELWMIDGNCAVCDTPVLPLLELALAFQVTEQVQ